MPRIAVTPIVGGQAIKGPAAKMLAELGHEVSALGVARYYKGLIDGFVLDAQDAALAAKIEALRMRVRVADTMIRNDKDKQAARHDGPRIRGRLADSGRHWADNADCRRSDEVQLDLAKGRLAAVLDPAGRRALPPDARPCRRPLRGRYLVRSGRQWRSRPQCDVRAAAHLVQGEGATDLLLVMADLPYLAADDIAALIEAGAEPRGHRRGHGMAAPTPCSCGPTVLDFCFATGQPGARRHAERARAAGMSR
jgi:hypothetical protein